MARIISVASYLPSEIIDNQDLSSRFPSWSPEKIYFKTGIRERRIASKDETSGDLAVEASKKLFERISINRSEIDMLIFVTQTPNQCLPSTSCEIHYSLSLKESCGCIDVNQGCTGFIYGLSLAASLIDVGSCRNILLLTADTYSKILDKNDSTVVPIFGDAASATLVAQDINNNRSIGQFVFGTDGSSADLLKCDYGGFRKGIKDWIPLKMKGPSIMEFTLRKVPLAVKEYFQKTETSLEDYDKIIFHQANKFILDHLYKKISATGKGVIDLEYTGNTISSTIPIALENLLFQNNQRHLRLLLVGFGVGLSWGVTSVYFHKYE